MKIHILCFGNLYRGDDGVGVHIYNKLVQMKMAKSVFLFDCGSLSLKSISLFENVDKVIIIDAIPLEDKEGSIKILSRDDVFKQELGYSSHENNLSWILSNLEIALDGKAIPEIEIIGVQIQDTQVKTSLSSNVAQSVDEVLKLLKERSLYE